MKPERWKKIVELVQAALDRSEEERSAFIAEACEGDDLLRREVESLLAYHNQASKFLESPAIEQAAELFAPSKSHSLEGETISHYKLTRKIGEGGMGAVYLARDTSLDRQVAIKFISLDSAEDSLARKRLAREARAAAKLDHPNICSVYEVGEQDGHSFIVMQYIEGETLSQRIHRKPLEISEAIDIAVQVADGLAEAHSQGIVHRDIKPHNIMITAREQAKLMDFGLAKVIPQGSAPGSEVETASLLTEPGAVIGTLPYMSPEQVRGERLDERSDIFCFGAVMYEMLSGRRPFSGESAAVIVSAILTQQPAPLARYSSETPAELQRIVNKALSKKREERYQTTKDLFLDLRGLRHQMELEAEIERSKEASSGGSAIGLSNGLVVQTASVSGIIFGKVKRHRKSAALLLAAIAVVAAAVFFYPDRTGALTEKDSVLIADFENKTGDEIFDGALKQALAVQLEQSPFLNIFPDERIRETLRYMSRSPDERLTKEVAREVCQRQGVKAMLVGSISPLGSNYIIGLEAINAQNGDVIAREQVQAENKEQVIATLGKAATRFRAKLGESLALIQKFDAPIEQATTSSIEALKAYSLGVEQLERGRFLEAIPLYKRAIELDPGFALAYARLSAAYNSTGQVGLVLEPAKKAFEMRERVSEREKFLISHRYYIATGELDKNIEMLELWKRTYPRDPIAHGNLANRYLASGQFEKALEEAREAISLNTSMIFPYTYRGYALTRLNRFDEAKAAYDQALAQRIELTRNSRRTLFEIAFVEGDPEAMKQQIDWAAEASSEHEAFSWQASTAAFSGQLRKARGLLSRAVDLAMRRSLKERAAQYLSDEAIMSGLLGDCRRSRKVAAQALSTTRSYPPLVLAALALASCGEVGQAQAVADELARRYPAHTLINAIWLPVSRAAIEIHRDNPNRAIQMLQATGQYEGVASFWPNYIRGQAFLRLSAGEGAMEEFQKILDHRGWDPTSYLYPLAHLGLARAAALAGDTAKSRKSYEEFFAVWKDADPDIPILIEARKEYAKLKQ